MRTGNGRASDTRAALRPLDFVVIGAAKSGTTTLYRLLDGHRQLFVPAGKENPFFTKDATYHQGWQRYLDEHFARARVDQRWGTVTPRYLGDLDVPARMHGLCPDARLIALLRHPVDRAFSKYRLLVRSSGETASFAEVVERQLEPDRLARARVETVPLRDAVVVRGEYGRLLGTFLDWYDPSQLLERFTDELEADPQAVLDDVCDHIGVSVGRRPPNLEVRAYEGGDAQRFPTATRAAVGNRVLRQAWHRLPHDLRRRVEHRYRTEVNVRRAAPGATTEAMDASTRARLVELYRADLPVLEEILGRQVPWPDLRANR